ncbi:MAG: transposase [Hyphomicrobium sp.]|nr:transposase [Hyphomicrobium sp.]
MLRPDASVAAICDRAQGQQIEHRQGEALERIGALFDVEHAIAGKPPDERRAVRITQAKPRLDRLADCFEARLKLIPSKTPALINLRT